MQFLLREEGGPQFPTHPALLMEPERKEEEGGREGGRERAGI